jgi:hypothetical protein
MSVLKVFEIHTFRSGVWKIDSVFDDRDLAIMEADRMDRSKRYSAVRVIEETFDEETDKGNTRTIFRFTKAQQINAATQTRQKQGLKVAAAPPPPKLVKKKKTITRQLIIAFFAFSAIAVGCIILLELLNSLTGVR